MNRPRFPLLVLVPLALAPFAVLACSSLTEPPSPEPVAAPADPNAPQHPEMKPLASALASAAQRPGALPATAQTVQVGPPEAPDAKLEIKDLSLGKGGRAVKTGDKVGVLYTGSLTNGTVFDASKNHGNKPFEFTVGQGQVIKGWDQGLLGMKPGGKRKLTIPSSLAYGDGGRPPVIPPKSTLVFEVEVVDIK